MKLVNKKIIVLNTRYTLPLLLLLPMLVLLLSLFCSNSITSAKSYESSVGVSFTLNPTISVTVSGDLTIANLTPGDYKDSNNITVTATSNSIAGYTLSGTVGSSTNASTELRKDGADAANKFSSITTNKSTLSDFDSNSNTWGYSYCPDTVANCNNDSTKWISGDITITDPSSPLYPTIGYNGLPLYTTETPTKLINSTTNGSSSVLFKIGARTTTNQIAGEYTNVINFIGVANANPGYITLNEATYMQDDFSCVATPEGTAKKLIDRRDNSDYTVKKINGQCWMTQNLRITGTISAEYSNFKGEDFNINKYSLDANDSSYIDHCDGTNGYNHACSKTSSDSAIGAWYNYYSASAGTISGDANTDPADSDICPINWHLPSGPNTASGTNLNILIGNSISGWQSATSGLVAFNAIGGGSYYNGYPQNITYSNWWMANPRSSAGQYSLYYNSSNQQFVGDGGDYRYHGYFIRCVKSS